MIYTVCRTLYTVLCIFYTVYRTVYTVYILHAIYRTVYIVPRTLYISQVVRVRVRLVLGFLMHTETMSNIDFLHRSGIHFRTLSPFKISYQWSVAGHQWSDNIVHLLSIVSDG